ncbi:MAG: AAA family ATPase, partial [Nitrospirae bacterium]|nr:AAA family ATPase [Nitrospirota bacterium]
MGEKVLFAWIGTTDLKASRGESSAGLGPIGQAVSKLNFSRVVLISNYRNEDEEHFAGWLRGKTAATILNNHVELTSPTDYKEIYEAAIRTIDEVKKKLGSKEIRATYHLSSGTPAMAA